MHKKQSEPTAGFGIIGVALIVVAVAIIGLLAWRFYDASKSQTPSSTASHTSSSSSSTQATTQTPPPKVDPYAGWKTYCDDVEKACFKYPSDWTVSVTNASNSYGIVSASLKNPALSVIGNYQNDDTRDSMLAPYYVAALEDPSTANASIKVLGGFNATTATVYPEYKVVDTSLTTGLAAGQQASVENTARFTFKNNRAGSLDIKPMGANGMTQDQAKAWFTSGDAKTAELIAKSFYFE